MIPTTKINVRIQVMFQDCTKHGSDIQITKQRSIRNVHINFTSTTCISNKHNGFFKAQNMARHKF